MLSAVPVFAFVSVSAVRGLCFYQVSGQMILPQAGGGGGKKNVAYTQKQLSALWRMRSKCSGKKVKPAGHL